MLCCLIAVVYIRADSVIGHWLLSSARNGRGGSGVQKTVGLVMSVEIPDAAVKQFCFTRVSKGSCQSMPSVGRYAPYFFFNLYPPPTPPPLGRLLYFDLLIASSSL
jgi:hypothetical protein